ncbi:MAG: hypothetical protein MK105_14890 [Crocinitomicaceae bacterium]|nr:hypothetical protein [Crocinitomicaceae bacterium]
MYLESENFISITLLLATIGLLISSLEILASRENYIPTGILSWNVLRLRPDILNNIIPLKIIDFIFDTPYFFGVIVFRIICLIALIYAIFYHSNISFPLTAIVISTFLINYRSSYGCDGSDQMLTIVFFTVCISSYFGLSHVGNVCLIFIGCQSCLSYFVSGVAKVIGKKWRKGIAVAEILSSQSYGNKLVGSFLKKHIYLSKLISWTTVIFECLFPIVLILPNHYLYFVLAFGLVFHISIALLMGLNIFFWAFVCTYPAIIYTSFSLNSILN